MSFSRSLVGGVQSRLPKASSSILIQSIKPIRSFATKTTDTHAESQAAIQAKQIRLAEKAGRMKQNIGMMTTVPVFANYVRPRSTRTTPKGLTRLEWWNYFKADYGNDIYTVYLRYGLRKALGKDWFKHFTKRITTAYTCANQAFATGNYKAIIPLASNELIGDIKAARSGALSGLRLNWKLHREVEQEIVCVRQQEISVLGEFVAQIAVRFVTEQSLEARNAAGVLIKGDHSKPVRVTEYYVFQRELWMPEADWKMVKKVQEIDPFGKDKDLFIKA